MTSSAPRTPVSRRGGHHARGTEAPEVEFLEISDEPPEFEEIVELIPCEAEQLGNANIFTDPETQQGPSEEEAPKN
uniref:Uncharacterized protein n=1 Tax=Setaria viridis TaxID=4556 RepID=A0A4U6UFV3_SETVI|nr:hypothetical protein SEVIR_5G200500v2 [Setaria viridis]